MKTYSEKLRDPRWRDFRAEFISSRPSRECDDCCEDTVGTLHVHHRLYRPGTEPWEYEFSELRLLCEECHGRIHDVEKRIRALTLTLAAHEAYEFQDFLDELEEANAKGLVKIAFARCKNAVRNINYSAEVSS